MIITVDKLSKSYGPHQVLKDISFQVSQPEVVALVGPNGVGKSTLLNTMVNLLDPDSGQVRFFGKPPTDVTVFQDLSFLRDNTVLYDYMTGYDHLTYAGGIYGLDRGRIDQVVARMEIGDFIHSRVQSYSLGMKQQLLIALALLNDPQILIMDEPLTGLDPSRVIMLRQVFLDLVQEGKTLLLSSHNLGEIDAVTRHILFLKDGQVREEYLDASQTCEDRYKEIYLLG